MNNNKVEFDKTKTIVKYRVDAVPLSILIFGIAIGVSLGIYTRDHGLLSPSQEKAKSITPSQLYNLSEKECEVLMSLDGKRLIQEFKMSSYKGKETILKEHTAPDNLKKYIKDNLCN
ncbi:MAG: hypothetical protein K0U47_07945 [Epsilonproteobacteria bacterium]|nr:hypothetical protein [Campylobacterota bacterium]